jgi:hypothetical protein
MTKEIDDYFKMVSRLRITGAILMSAIAVVAFSLLFLSEKDDKVINKLNAASKPQHQKVNKAN